jgi:hypothetical protein
MNYKINKETRCKMCGDSILIGHKDMASFIEKMGRFCDISRLSTIKMREHENTIECHEQKEDVFYFHPDCIKSVLKANCFNWLKDDQ